MSILCNPEDNKHLLECSHPDWAKLFSTLKNMLTLYTQKLQLHPCIFTSMWLGLVTTHMATPYPEIIEEVLLPLQKPIQIQAHLGSNQLYYGQFSGNWAKAINNLHLTTF